MTHRPTHLSAHALSWCAVVLAAVVVALLVAYFTQATDAPGSTPGHVASAWGPEGNPARGLISRRTHPLSLRGVA